MDQFFIILLTIVWHIGFPLLVFYLVFKLVNFICSFGIKGTTESENSPGEDIPKEAAAEAEEKSHGQQAPGQQAPEPAADEIVEPAKIGDRFLSALVDHVMIRLPLSLIFITAFTVISPSFLFVKIYVLLDFILVMSYYAVFAHRRNGQTLGKKWNSIRVVDMKGRDVKLVRFLIREFTARGIPALVAIVSPEVAGMWIVTYLLVFTKERQALHDIVAGTQVVSVGETKKD